MIGALMPAQGGGAPTALDDPLLAALVGKLPAAGAPFDRAQRVNWLRMMVMAFSAAYGVEDGIVVSVLEDERRKPLADSLQIVSVEEGRALRSPDAASPPGGITAVPAKPPRYCIDSQGFALRDNMPVDPQDIPPDAVIHDERSPAEQGDIGTVYWKTGGAIAAEKLPPRLAQQLRAA